MEDTKRPASWATMTLEEQSLMWLQAHRNRTWNEARGILILAEQIERTPLWRSGHMLEPYARELVAVRRGWRNEDAI